MSQHFLVVIKFGIKLLCLLSCLQLITAKNIWLYENEMDEKICYNPNNNQGLCVAVKECESFNFVVRNNLKENFNFFYASQCQRETGNPPFVCCTHDIKLRDAKSKKGRNGRIIFPDEFEKVKKAWNKSKIIKPTDAPAANSTESSSLDNKSVAESLLWPKKCGGIVVANKIYGGHDADLSEFSWMVILEYRNQTTGELVLDCAGSLINSRYVLTAAHCVQGQILRVNGKLESVRVGEHNTNTEVDCLEGNCQPLFKRMAIESFISHSNFSFRSEYGTRNHHDIALLRLKEQVEFNINLQPVCLPTEANIKDLEELKLVVAGWGHNGSMVRTATKQKLELPVVNHGKCRESYKNKFYLADEQLCAGGRFREDSCNGDSGGPLMRINKDFWIIEGIVSFGLKCGLEQPGVYTNVRSYLEWIHENVKL